ncbi:MAG: radical SAM protein [Armatimonadota bacterium]
MKVCLIYPLVSKEISHKEYDNNIPFPPLGLAYIAAVLKKNNHKVKIIDRNKILKQNDLNLALTDEITLNLIKEFSPSIVGFGATTPLMWDVDHFSKIVKKNFPNIITVCGGPHPTSETDSTLKNCTSIDIAVAGEGELTALELANGLPLEEIKGLSFRKNGEIITTEHRPLIKDMDSIPFPARELLDMKYYHSYFPSRHVHERTTSIFTTRGCPYRCNFCAGPVMFEGKVRFHSPGYVVKEVKELLDNYKFDTIFFADDLFLANRKRAEEICNLFIKEGINKRTKWIAQIRTELVEPDLLHLMKKAGCLQVEFGFESGSQRMLDIMNKKHKVEDYYRVAKTAHGCNMRFQCNLIIGYPGEKEDDLIKTIDFIREIKPTVTQVSCLWPLPGTRVYKELLTKGFDLAWDSKTSCASFNFTDMPDEKFKHLSGILMDEAVKLNWKNYKAYHFRHNLPHMFELAAQKAKRLLKIK